MISAQIVILVALIFYVSAFYLLNIGSVKSSLFMLFTSVLLTGWLLVAYYTPMSCLGITYHPVISQATPNGKQVDIILLESPDGAVKVVNINSVLGVNVPDDKKYQVVRLEFQRSGWGIFFGNRNSYRVVELK